MFGCLCVQLGVEWAGDQVPPQPFTFTAAEWGRRISRQTFMKGWGSQVVETLVIAQSQLLTRELEAFVFGAL